MVAYKEPVRLRRRANKSGRVSLYLDIYVDGRRSYEFLKLYLVAISAVMRVRLANRLLMSLSGISIRVASSCGGDAPCLHLIQNVVSRWSGYGGDDIVYAHVLIVCSPQRNRTSVAEPSGDSHLLGV